MIINHKNTSLYYTKVFPEKAISGKIENAIFPSIYKAFPPFFDVFSDHVLQARGRGVPGLFGGFCPLI